MSIRTLKRWALLLTFWVALQTKALRATPITGDTVSGNFTATGTADIQGATLSLGMRSDNSNPGWAASYTDGSNAYVDFLLSRSSGTWRWSQNAGSTSKLQLTLDNNNKLILFDQSSTPAAKITLNPLGTSTFANSVTLNGTDNEMPNQTLVNSYSVLTESLADGRYLTPNRGDSRYLRIDSGALTWDNDTYATAVAGSIVFGVGSDAYNTGSVVIGDGSTSSGNYAYALGWRVTAAGWGSIAMGAHTTANGVNSTASGFYSTASGNYSAALGFFSTAQAYESLTIGQFNVGGGDPNYWVSTDPLFEIGNGTASTYDFDNWVWINNSSDAFVVYKNGNAAVQGNLSIGASITASGSINTTDTINAASLSTSGLIHTSAAITANGTITADGTVTAPTVIITAPTGDIPMFTGY